MPVELSDLVGLGCEFRSLEDFVPAIFDGEIRYRLIVDRRLTVYEKIILSYGVLVDIRFSGYMIDDGLGEKHPLRCPEPSEGRVGRQISGARISGHPNVRNVIRVRDVTSASFHGLHNTEMALRYTNFFFIFLKLRLKIKVQLTPADRSLELPALLYTVISKTRIFPSSSNPTL